MQGKLVAQGLTVNPLGDLLRPDFGALCRGQNIQRPTAVVVGLHGEQFLHNFETCEHKRCFVPCNLIATYST